jgi:ketosteroid isomerase-like protein
MGDPNVEVVRGAYDAFARGDLPAVLEMFTDDIEWYEAEGMPYPGERPFRGPQAVAENVIVPLSTDVEGFAVAPEELIPAGATVVAVTRYTGTGKETGKELDLPVVHVWDVRDGKLARFRQFADTVKFREVVPADVATVA